jgi:predicted TIM-barrel fold metal-dependent hydrolase
MVAASFTDSHVHLWTHDFNRYPLASEFSPSDMLRTSYTPEDLFRDAAASAVDRFVLVQMSYYGFDNSYMLDAIRAYPGRFRGIAIVDPESKSPAQAMLDLSARGVGGFRIYMESTHPQPVPGHPGYEKMFLCAQESQLAICPLIDPRRLPEIEQQCRRFPRTIVVIDHLARIGVNLPIDEADVRALCALAKYPEVRVKLSGFYALGERRVPHLDMAPLIRRVYEAFGPKRLLWGSDVPFQLTGEIYEDSISLIRDRLDFLSAADRNWILGRSAEELFFAGTLQSESLEGAD